MISVLHTRSIRKGYDFIDTYSDPFELFIEDLWAFTFKLLEYEVKGP